MMTMRARTAAVVIGSAAGAWWLRPSWGQLSRLVGAPGTALDTLGVDRSAVIVCAAVLWLICLRLLIGAAALSLAKLPGTAGRIAARISRVALPRLAMRLLAGAAGAGILVSPALAVAATAGAPPAAVAGAAHGTVATGTRNFVVTARERSAPIGPISGPSGAWPLLPADAPPADAAPADAVTVRPADSLWLIAARRLGPDATPAQIASAWPAWYAANRTVIGDDPGLIRPGQRLQPPGATSAPRVATGPSWPTSP